MDHRSKPNHRSPVHAPHDVAARATSAARALGEAAADEAAADEARRRLRERGMVPIEPDDCIGALLVPGERVVAVRRAASLERRMGSRDPGEGLRGDLYVTTRRLVFCRPVPVEYPLAEIREVDVSATAVLLVVGENRGVAIRVHDPRVLRVEIAAAREANRASTAGGASVLGAGTRRSVA